MNSSASPHTAFCEYSLRDPEAFWIEQATAIDWRESFERACDFSRPPFARWFPGGRTNLCHNAVDRHLPERAGQPAIRFFSSETGEQRTLTYRELHREVNRMAGVLQRLGVAKGDRVVLYLPMIAEAAIALLACARLGAIHSVVFAGFAAESLARRIRDAGRRNGKLIPLKRTADEALRLAESAARVLVIDRGLDPEAPFQAARDVRFADLAEAEPGEIPCVWLEAGEPSYVLYTSGTTAKPKGVQRDTGGYAVALAASMRHIFDGRPGETFFSTADIGWVVGHSYNVYGPLLLGMTTVLYEGLPVSPNAGIWWKIAAETRTSVMFSSPTAMRILKKHQDENPGGYDLSNLRILFLAGEPLDEPTWQWAQDLLPHVQIIDNYWQTETGWPVLAQMPGLGPTRGKPGSPGKAVYGYDAFIADEHTGEPLPRGQKGVLALRLPLPPGALTTVWNNDALFVEQYCSQFPGKLLYSTFDYAVQDEDGFFFILGRIDDVINVAGHRIGTREIEEALCAHPAVAEAAAVGAADEVKWQVVKCFVVLKQPEHYPAAADRAAVAKDIENIVVTELGALARPAFLGVVRQLPKTRSGKIVRRAILAIAEGRDPGDLSTLEDPAALDHIREAHAAALIP
jgi:propionyl-CoA synthetase